MTLYDSPRPPSLDFLPSGYSESDEVEQQRKALRAYLWGPPEPTNAQLLQRLARMLQEQAEQLALIAERYDREHAGQ